MNQSGATKKGLGGGMTKRGFTRTKKFTTKGGSTTRSQAAKRDGYEEVTLPTGEKKMMDVTPDPLLRRKVKEESKGDGSSQKPDQSSGVGVSTSN